MKIKFHYLVIMTVLALSGCRGPKGDPGPQGDTIDSRGIVFDLINVNFTEGNKYQYALSFADAKISVKESDAVMIYIHWENVDGLKVYRPLPQSVFFNNGILSYNFDRTKEDFAIFLEGTINKGTLADDWTKNQAFRIVVIPSEFARSNAKFDYNDYNSVEKALNINNLSVRTIR